MGHVVERNVNMAIESHCEQCSDASLPALPAVAAAAADSLSRPLLPAGASKHPSLVRIEEIGSGLASEVAARAHSFSALPWDGGANGAGGGGVGSVGGGQRQGGAGSGRGRGGQSCLTTVLWSDGVMPKGRDVGAPFRRHTRGSRTGE